MGEGARDEASEAATIVLAIESTLDSKLLVDLAGRRGRVCGLGDKIKGRAAGSDGGGRRTVSASAARAWANAIGSLLNKFPDVFLPLSKDAVRGACAPDRRGAGGSGTMRGKGVNFVEHVGVPDRVVAPVGRPSDCPVAAVAPVSLTFEQLEATKSSRPGVSEDVLSDLVAGKVGLIDGLVGTGLAIANIGFVT